MEDVEEKSSSNGIDRMKEEKNPNSIELPETIEVFRNLKNAKRFAIDIGKGQGPKTFSPLRLSGPEF